MYLSKSTDGGVTWIEVARIDSNYFDAKIGDRKYVEGANQGASSGDRWVCVMN